jgi:hypothetical protein
LRFTALARSRFKATAYIALQHAYGREKPGHELSTAKYALIGTLGVLVSIRIAAVIVGIAAIKSIEPES